MQFEEYPNIEFYTLEEDENKIFAEYIVPSNDDISPNVLNLRDIDSPKFSSFLRLEVIPNMDAKITANDIIREVRDYINVRGCEDVIITHMRTAGTLSDEVVEYALYNKCQQYVRIDKTGWNIVDTPTYKFVANSMSKPQIKPKRTCKNLLDLMSPYINAKKDAQILTILWMVQCFLEGNHFALLMSAPSGSGKTVLSNILRAVLDPSKTGVSILNTKGDSLLTTLTNSYLVAFDNTRPLDPEESDIMCVSVTSGVYTKREAFSTNTNAVFRLHNAIILNGVNILPRESDFAQRCLLLQLESITPKTRMLKSELMKKFNNDVPEILGAIFDTISKAMTIADSVELKEKSRMADEEKEMTAIAIALGISQEEFKRIYDENRSELDKARSKTDLFFAVQEYMSKVNKKSIEGTVSQIYSKICNSYSGGKAELPKSPSQFSRKLSLEYQAFLSAGIRINLDDTYTDGTHIKIIKK